LGKAYTYLSMRAVLLLSLMASGGFSQTTQSSEDNDQNYMQSSGESGEGSVDSDESSTESSVEVSAAPTQQSKEDKAAAKKAAKKAAKSQPPTPASWVPPPAGQILGGDPSTWTPLDLPQMDDPSTWDSPQPIMGRDPSTWTPLNQGQMGGNPSTWAPPQPIMGRDPSTWTPLNPVRDPSTWTGQLGGDPSTWTPLNLPQGPFGGAQFGSQFGSASQVSVGSQAAVGGDGSCQPNSGFMWCAAKQKCLQPWVETCLQFGQVSDTGVSRTNRLFLQPALDSTHPVLCTCPPLSTALTFQPTLCTFPLATQFTYRAILWLIPTFPLACMWAQLLQRLMYLNRRERLVDCTCPKIPRRLFTFLPQQAL